MTEVHGGLDYGRFGSVQYDTDRQLWVKERSFDSTANLKRLRGFQQHTSLAPSQEYTRKARFKNAAFRHLQYSWPELGGAGQLADVLASSERANEDDAADLRATGDVLDFATVTGRHSKPVRLVAFAVGDCGQELCLIRGRDGREGWEDTHQNTLATTHFDDSRACFFDGRKGPIMQIALSSETKYGQVLVAVRYRKGITVLKASLASRTTHDLLAPPEILLQTYANDLAFPTGMEDVLSLCFDASTPNRLLTVHEGHYARLWNLPREKRGSITLGQELAFTVGTAFDNPLSPATLTPLPESQFIFGYGTLLVLFRFDVRNYLESHSTQFNLASRILDVKHCPGHCALVVALTSERIFWITITYAASLKTANLKLLKTWRHHRDAVDGWMRLSVLCMHDNKFLSSEGAPQACCSVLLYSRQDPSVLEYQFYSSQVSDMHLEPNIGIKQPILFPLLAPQDKSENKLLQRFQVLSLRAFALRLENEPKYASRTTSSDPSQYATWQFFQVFTLDHGRLLSSCIAYRPVSGSQSFSIEPLSWSRTLGTRVLSGAVATEAFVAHDEGNSSVELQRTEEPRWWTAPRKKQLVARIQVQVSTNESFVAGCEAIREHMSIPAAYFSPAVDSLSQQLKMWAKRVAAPPQLCAQLVNFTATPDDLLDASEHFQTLLSETAVASQQPGALRALTVPFANILRTAWAVPNLHLKSMKRVYLASIEDKLAPLSAQSAPAMRLFLEKAVRRITMAQILSTTLIVSGRSENDNPPLDCEGDSGVPKSSDTTLPPQTSQVTVDGPSQVSYKELVAASRGESLHRRHTGCDSLSSAVALVKSFAGTTESEEKWSYNSAQTERILHPWQSGCLEDSVKAPMNLDLSRYDSALDAPTNVDQQEESQRQSRKSEKYRRRQEQASLAKQTSSQAFSTGSSQPITGQFVQSSQTLRALKLQQPSSQQRLASSQLPAQLSILEQSQSQPRMRATGTNGLPSSNLPINSKRDHQNVFGPQATNGLPLRKKRKAGF